MFWKNKIQFNEIKEYKLFNLVENQIFAIEFFLLKMKSFYNIKLSFVLEKYLNTVLNMKEIKIWLLEARRELK